MARRTAHPRTLGGFDQALKAERALSPGMLRALKQIPPGEQRTAALRGGVGILGLFDPEAEDTSTEANRRKALRLTTKIPTIVAAQHRLAAGLKPLNPAGDSGTRRISST